MDRQIDIKPRKLPRQERAKMTYRAIVDGTTQLLLREGYENFTTAGAAERTGVSVGTLYQYFPNKAALAAAVFERCCENFLTAFHTTVSGHETLAKMVQAVVEFTFVSPHVIPELHKIVRELAPRIGIAQKAERISQAAALILEQQLQKHASEISEDIDLGSASIIIEALMETLAHRMLETNLGAVEKARIAQEANRLVSRYLERTR